MEFEVFGFYIRRFDRLTSTFERHSAQIDLMGALGWFIEVQMTIEEQVSR